jgi:hypothetical protein
LNGQLQTLSLSAGASGTCDNFGNMNTIYSYVVHGFYIARREFIDVMHGRVCAVE